MIVLGNNIPLLHDIPHTGNTPHYHRKGLLDGTKEEMEMIRGKIPIHRSTLTFLQYCQFTYLRASTFPGQGKRGLHHRKILLTVVRPPTFQFANFGMKNDNIFRCRDIVRNMPSLLDRTSLDFPDASDYFSLL